ncbi:MAG TPA: DUF2189 domain-containing protein [Gammaproteobacteria bacterium]|nr:DUF2189 domain-containing protein [Gammaproteobacteria bacterium]
MNKVTRESAPAASAPVARSFSLADIADALAQGWGSFRAMPAPSMAYALVFVLIGLVLLAAVGWFGLSPMALPFAGGFMLVGPALLTGFFRLETIRASGRRPRLLDAFGAFARTPGGLWLVTLLCTFLFLIWITDTAILYAMMIGSEALPYELPWLIGMREHVIAFELWGSLMGSILAFIILSVSAFSVPLLHEGRASLVGAVNASVRAVFGNIGSSIAWGVMLSAVTLVSIVLLPLLAVTLPVLAYASFALYRKVFPLEEGGPG